ncbi:sugar O-acetyltransferase [Sphingobacterium sp. UT-1RO-CII-1]|uniref:sugar O-acetyltransferase n=1 Tax=Sphingobacterium sp. UT-1RO-CII-1 TaxID=2995225 RepID=UPI00227C5CC0|nr:sugar O-acetyltransferase [Sphingobacterium sp. UT-1RO-CII-1]MCY4779447.1 sugar O-acetyltransferase [Sphingobacterium sp. UT-1RO-CII-1]
MNIEKSVKQKMISGDPYQANGRELFDDRQRAKQALQTLNLLDPSKIKERNSIIKNLLGKTAKGFFIEPPFRCDYGYNIEVGNAFYANYNLTILDSAPVIIGNNVLIGPNVSLFTASHPIDSSLRIKGWEIAKPITIEDAVWIGGNTVINPGVTIGAGTVIGSGSVVTKNIPAGVVAAGNPCRIIRKITDQDKEDFSWQIKKTSK